MASRQKLNANRANAQLSNGPRDTTITRLNALRHGILSREVLITGGEGQEDAEQFQELNTALREDLAPLGALEDLLVEQLITITWRLRRVLRYETAAVRERSDTATEDWERTRTEDESTIRQLLGFSIRDLYLAEETEDAATSDATQSMNTTATTPTSSLPHPATETIN